MGELVWDVECVHIRPAFYQVDYYAHDDVIHGASPPFSVTLSDNHITKIKVRPNPVRNLVLTPGSRQMLLNWDPNDCPNALGYEIYRSFGQSGFVPDSVCCEGTPSDGFERIAYVQGWDSTTFLDNNNGLGLEFRDVYCYRIVTVFPGGYRSCPSEEACARIRRDFVLMTNDSVAFTDASAGAIFVSWSTPDSLDPNFFPPPYTYQLQRAEGGGPFQPILTNIPFTDTTFTDAGLNTQQFAYRYQVLLFDSSGAEVVPARSNVPSSIFLTTTPAHESVLLTWTEAVPWLNTMYYVFRADNFTGTYTLIDSVPGNGAGTHSYRATGLKNGEDYCFFVRSTGTYNTVGVKDPLINDSQRTCEVPRDTVPPCLPSRDSLLASASPDCEALTVQFHLTRPTDSCAADFARYFLYYSPDSLGSYTLIHTFSDPNNLSFTFNGGPQGSIAGCYRFAADDTLGNISLPSEPFCFDNCPLFQLVNVFTPNGDGTNDFFKPIFLRSVREIKLTIFDRWGVEVMPTQTFRTPTQATPLWDGNARNGTPAPAGVYYYVLEATLEKLAPVVFQRTGSVTLLR
jgi:gliding motility-associated-like protein